MRACLASILIEDASILDEAHPSRLSDGIERSRKGFLAVTAFSLCINLLMLTAPLFMLQLFDRVLSSRSIDTLFFLLLIAGLALFIMAAFEIVRGITLIRTGGGWKII